nr:hypothetical protein BaRGS_013208 [Batillaria attramentaria]
MTWNEARTACLLSGGHLASFNTREEWRDVTDAILGRRLLDVLVGLKTSGTSLPHMYKTALQWEDNTIAYYSSRLKKVESTACGHISAPVITSMEFFSSPIRPDVVTLDYCDAQMMTYFLCEKEACVRLDALCDGQPQCVNGDDEAYCDTKDVNVQRDTPPPPAIVHFTRDNSILIKPVNTSDKLNAPHPCPQPHFQCPGGDYCLPVFVRCNGVYDCPGKEDEAECDSYTCPGFYRCRASRVCLHPDHVCDGIYQCPQHDDEMLCDVICPASCTCHGLALFCGVFLAAHLHPNLRYLDASGSGMGLQHLTKNVMLVHLGLARCDVTHLPSVDLPNLHSLDLSDNRLNVLRHESLQALKNLRVLCVAGNPLSPQIFSQSSTPVAFSLLRTLDLSRVEIRDLDARAFTRFPNLQFLNLSDTGVDVVHKAGLQSLNLLRVLDVRGCPMNIFPDHVFHGMDRLETVYADNYKLCCPAVLPEGVNINKCQAPADDVLVFALVTKNTVPPLISNDLSREISSARRVQTLALSHSLCRKLAHSRKVPEPL